MMPSNRKLLSIAVLEIKDTKNTSDFKARINRRK